VLGPVELVDEVDSTNRVLLDRAREGAPHGLVLVADHQTAGRGRLDRTWEAEPGAALLVSVLLRPQLAPGRLHRLTMAAAVAAVDACRAVAGVGVDIKWPNDLVVDDGRKLAGLLAESIVEAERVVAVVVGMGLNLRADRLPEGAVALEQLAGHVVERDPLLMAWLEGFGTLLTDVDGKAALPAYRSRCSTLGRDVRVERPDGVLEGVARDVTDDGRLLVDAEGGPVAISVGDVTHVRHVSAP
jgi:BirA family transcriptional regulator, biotin operon repressor / biotin---[acetyl-CoA-carboxylase] ligase